MDLQVLQDLITSRIKKIELFRDLSVLSEDKGNITVECETAIAKESFAVVVGGLTFSDTKPNSSLAIGDVGLTISLFENPTFNREDPSRPTINSAAQAIVKALKLFNTGDGLLTSPSIGELQDLGEGVISRIVRFSLTNVTL